MCITTLSYVWQFAVATPYVLATEARMLQRLVACPRFTFSKDALLNLDAVGMATSFKSVQVCNIAAIVRMTLQTSSSFGPMKRLLDEARTDDTAPMMMLASEEYDFFDTPAIVNTMQKVIDHAFLPGALVPAWKFGISTIDCNEGIQKQVVKQYHQITSQFNAANFMTKRMARWSALVSADAQVWWTFCGAFAVQFCTVDLQGAPQCVVAAVLKTLLNGWCTSRRFSESESLCKFGCGQKADCIEHYIQCAVVQRIWRELFRKEWGGVRTQACNRM